MPLRAKASQGGGRFRASVAAIALLLAACSMAQNDAAPPGARGAADETVQVRLFQFRPDVLEVAAGTTVVWMNEDEILHTATAGTIDDPAPGVFDGQLDGPDSSFSHTFNEPGRFPYLCTRHPTAMTGTIIVRGM